MKNLLTALAILISLNGCESDEDTGNAKTVNPDGRFMNFVVIDSCEYIESAASYGYNTYTHKGNCSNPVHKTFIHQ